MKITKSWAVLAIVLGGITLGFLTSGCTKQDETRSAGAPAAGVKPYPLDICVVSGEKLGSMGKPVVYVHECQEMKFCCKDCVEEFKKDPAKYLAKLKPGTTPEGPKS
jgi:hypothetical protein